LRLFAPGIGAEIMGANKFGPPGWHEDPEWKGWWGPNPPFHTPVFVLTHHTRPPIEMEGGTTFHFIGLEKDYEVEPTSSPSGVTHVTFSRSGVSTASSRTRGSETSGGLSRVPPAEPHRHTDPAEQRLRRSAASGVP
jgi:hypothetical protein